MRRTSWSDDRLDDKMGAIDATFEMLRDEMQGMRAELRGEMQEMRTELRGEMQGLRTELRDEMQGLRTELREDLGGLRHDFAALQTTLVQIGFGLVGVLLAAMIALIVALA